MIKSHRIESIDVLRGIVMIIMCLDHTRDYFQDLAITADPMDIDSTSPGLFITRYITHFCAPVFVFLSGTSIYLQAQRKTKPELAKFLFTRGLWLIFLEVTLNTFIWNFDIYFNTVVLQVIWAIGASMVVLSGLIFLPRYILLIVGVLIVFGHNYFDDFRMDGGSFLGSAWIFIDQSDVISYGTGDRVIVIFYPMLAWLGIMVLGFASGKLYDKKFDPKTRKKTLLFIGSGALVLFVILRTFNLYGDSFLFDEQQTWFKNVVSFLRVTKYPASLQFTLITLGVSLIVLALIETIRNRFTNFAITFGRVPLFFYFLHMLVIHLSSMLIKPLVGESMYSSIAKPENVMNGQYRWLGIEGLWHVYLAWILIIAALYIPCLYYMRYKANNREKKWLSYL